jgi:hypothetical protein
MGLNTGGLIDHVGQWLDVPTYGKNGSIGYICDFHDVTKGKRTNLCG